MDNFIWKTISEYNVKQWGWGKTPNIDCFLILSIECIEKADLLQLTTSLSSDTEKQLW